MRKFLIGFFSLLLAGCASQVPRAVSEPPPRNLSVAEVRAKQGPIGAQVRWGGTIAKVENYKTETWIEVVERPLDNDGRPQQLDQSGGRFLARVDGFLDPAIYAPGRQITVAGLLQENTTRQIGDYTYTFPVVKVISFYLWPPLSKQVYHDPWYDPWYPWHDPFYDPWYPYFPPRFPR
jgi:outer membrane lipoprotein